MHASSGHVPVLPEQCLELLDPRPGETFLDCTAGRGGHGRLFIERLSPGGRWIGLDLDSANIAFGREQLRAQGCGVDLVQANFADAPAVLERLQVGGVDGLLADLGFASSQMDDPQRGMSFQQDGPLDMRLDPSAGQTAADLVNGLEEQELADLIYEYGEERASRRIARKIVDRRRQRPIESTSELASICVAAAGGRADGRIHPATRTFQALRIAVNDELGNLRTLLADLPGLLRPGGRAAIISFHSLEDRMVKQAFAKLASQGIAERLNRKPLTADSLERAANRRSRSAKIRAIRLAGVPMESQPR